MSKKEVAFTEVKCDFCGSTSKDYDKNYVVIDGTAPIQDVTHICFRCIKEYFENIPKDKFEKLVRLGVFNKTLCTYFSKDFK